MCCKVTRIAQIYFTTDHQFIFFYKEDFIEKPSKLHLFTQYTHTNHHQRKIQTLFEHMVIRISSFMYFVREPA